MCNRIIVFLIFLLTGNSLLASRVMIEDAKRAALSFYFERAGSYFPVDYSSLHIRESIVVVKDDFPVYYAFNINETGYVIVSADDAVPPVLAYSFEGNYPEKDPAPQFTAWMDQYAGQIRYAIQSHATASASTEASWKHLLHTTAKKLSPLKSTKDVQPMITSNWNQPYPYNEMCPADPAGSGGHAVVGCVPVAMGQIMYYFRWPDHGTGSYTYFDSTYGTQHASFVSTWYRWDNMKNTISGSDSGIAQLLYHLGVSVDLKYGASGSGMYNHKAAYSMKTYFKYSPETRYVFRDSTSLNWDSLIITHLDRGIPMYYAGWSVPNINGHAFVCDGYQGGDYFHFNFGWAGSSNGYFYLDNLTPGGNNFNLAQELIINCVPDTVNYTYPLYCNGNKILFYNQGSLTDGSGPGHNYTTGSDCSWLINPQNQQDSITNITLAFDNFKTDSADKVTVYDGGSAQSAILGTFSGNTLPPSVTSGGNKMFVSFRSVSSTPSDGWSANYSTTTPVWCTGTKTITADTAEITDGSYSFNYRNNQSCRWIITPQDQKKPLTIYFREFDTEPGKDILRIYDHATNDTLAILSGHYDSSNLPDSVSSPSGTMFLMFNTSNTATGKGWRFIYPRSTEGIPDDNPFYDLQVYPNPVNGIIRISFGSRNEMNLELVVSSLLGPSILSVPVQCCTGRNNFMLDLTGITPGVYILQLKSSKSTVTKKIIISTI